MTGFLDRRQGQEVEPARARPPIVETETLSCPCCGAVEEFQEIQ